MEDDEYRKDIGLEMELNNDVESDTIVEDESDKLVESTEGLVCTPDKIQNIEFFVGMEFSTSEEIQHLYAEYGKAKGFQIRVRNSRERFIQFVCYREDFPFKRKKAGEVQKVTQLGPNKYGKSCKQGCRASLHRVFDSKSKVWRLSKFDDEHNHQMVTPRCRKFLRTHKKLTTAAKCLSQVFDGEGIPVGKVINVLNPNLDEAEFTQKDCYNYVTSVRKQILDVGDAQAVHEFYTRQQVLNHSFRFSIQLDSDDRMINFFWVDARSRAAYQTFGDVISFDTIYKTNKYSMSFAPFVGLDNHMHTILFGCALLQDETDATFEWLFKTWLEAMDGKIPKAIVTDQDMAIMNAVRAVFPSSKHRLCIWHIKKKFPEKLSHLYHGNSSFKSKMNKCIHDSINGAEFEDSWKRLVIEYKLENNEWLSHLFQLRQIWAPVYCKHMFYGGMNTTGRSESINSFFDRFVNSGTTLKQFVQKYGNALETRYETFRRAEFDSIHKNPILTLGMRLEKHAASIYTSEVFEEFHKELITILTFDREVIVDEKPVISYRVKKSLCEGKGYIVRYNCSTNDANCECQMFEFKGILCGHILSVLFVHNVQQIPQQYILPRWSKNVGRNLWDLPIARERKTTTSVAVVQMKVIFEDLCEMCDRSENVAEYVKNALDATYAGAKARLAGEAYSQQHGPTAILTQQLAPTIVDPNVVQTKGRRKNVSKQRCTRIRSGIEISSDPSVKCSVCYRNGHNRRTCPKVRED